MLFSGKENVFMCLVAFQKNFWKIFSRVWRRRRKRQTQKKEKTARSRSSRDRNRRRNRIARRSTSGDDRTARRSIAIYRDERRDRRAVLPFPSLVILFLSRLFFNSYLIFISNHKSFFRIFYLFKSNGKKVRINFILNCRSFFRIFCLFVCFCFWICWIFGCSETSWIFSVLKWETERAYVFHIELGTKVLHLLYKTTSFFYLFDLYVFLLFLVSQFVGIRFRSLKFYNFGFLQWNPSGMFLSWRFGFLFLVVFFFFSIEMN